MKRLLSTINKQRPGAGELVPVSSFQPLLNSQIGPSGDAPAYAEDSPESTILKEVVSGDPD